jgi:hypothetical protein
MKLSKCYLTFYRMSSLSRVIDSGLTVIVANRRQTRFRLGMSDFPNRGRLYSYNDLLSL